jgi:hypothetical protein
MMMEATVTIDLKSEGSDSMYDTISRQIAVIEKAAMVGTVADATSLLGVKSILVGIRSQLSPTARKYVHMGDCPCVAKAITPATHPAELCTQAGY